MKIIHTVSVVVRASLFLFLFSGAPGHAVSFKCSENVADENVFLGTESRFAEKLYDETLTYLNGYVELLEEKSSNCSTGAKLTTQNVTPKSEICSEKVARVRQIIRHSRVILDNPKQFSACFDFATNLANVESFTPSMDIQNVSPVAKHANRILLDDFYEKAGLNSIVTRTGVELSRDFRHITNENIVNDQKFIKMSAINLPNLWFAVGWNPMYSSRLEPALSERFRGGYLYAEVVGPVGLLRVDSIEGEPFNLELGMTVQISDSWYPYHFHDPMEIYIDISERSCEGKDTSAFINLRQSGLGDSIGGRRNAILLGPGGLSASFSPSYLGQIKYFERDTIHSFKVPEACSEHDPYGLISIWSRLSASDDYSNQATYICNPLDPQFVQRPIPPERSEFICHR